MDLKSQFRCHQLVSLTWVIYPLTIALLPAASRGYFQISGLSHTPGISRGTDSRTRYGSSGKFLVLDFQKFTNLVGLMSEALPGVLRECADPRELAFYRSHVKRFGKVADPYDMPRYLVADSLRPLSSTSTDVSFLDGCSC